VTDNAASMIKACDILKVRNLPSYAHTLNLVVQEVLHNDSINEIIKKCKRIVGYIKSSSIATSAFLKEQGVYKPLKLIQEVPTRWNSFYYMIERLIHTNDSVAKTLLKNKKSPPPLHVDDIVVLKDLCNLLAIFEEATKKISGSKYITVSLISPITLGIHLQIKAIKMQSNEGLLIQK
jgi:hypothetical protein